MLKKIEEDMSTMRRKLEDIGGSQIEHPEMKNMVSEMKNELNGTNYRLETTEYQ